MSDLELLKSLEPWVDNLAVDAQILKDQLDQDISREVKKIILGGLSYLIRKVDIIPDYMGGIGVLDDASVIRVTAKLAVEAGLPSNDKIQKLVEEVKVVEDVLGDLYPKLEHYVKNLPNEKIRNRTADTILDEEGSMEQFMRELEDEIRTYKPKPLGSNERTLREFRSFMKSKIR